MPEAPGAPCSPQNGRSAPGAGRSDAVLAFDFGIKRIGVAVGEAGLGIAHPLTSISFQDNRRRFEAIADLVDTWRPARIVVGLPGGGESDHPLAARVRGFAQRMRGRFGLPVDLVDEHLSSWEASRKLSRGGMRAAAQKPLVDAMAACVILETWFETNRPSAASRQYER